MNPKRPARVIWGDRGWLSAYYGFCPNEAAWRYQMRKLKSAGEPYPMADANCTSFESEDGDLVVLVTINARFDKSEDTAAVAGLMAHEAMHVWRHMRKQIGEHDPSTEFEAYAIQAIVVHLMAAYKQTRRPKAIR